MTDASCKIRRAPGTDLWYVCREARILEHPAMEEALGSFNHFLAAVPFSQGYNGRVNRRFMPNGHTFNTSRKMETVQHKTGIRRAEKKKKPTLSNRNNIVISTAWGTVLAVTWVRQRRGSLLVADNGVSSSQVKATSGVSVTQPPKNKRAKLRFFPGQPRTNPGSQCFRPTQASLYQSHEKHRRVMEATILSCSALLGWIHGLTLVLQAHELSDAFCPIWPVPSSPVQTEAKTDFNM